MISLNEGLGCAKRLRGKFSAGTVVSTPGALEKVPADDIVVALGRHLSGDWGNLDKEDRISNNEALKSGGRLLSSYTAENGVKFWIITEADRQVTTILLPDEY
jgi:hypothetical protein